MANCFNEVSPATTSIEVKNVPVVAGIVKNSMLSYKYANNCEWFNPLSKATSVKEIFDIAGIKFELKENRFYPVIKDLPIFAGYKTILEKVAPYMNDGELIAKDDYHYYLLKFSAGKITGTRRTISDNNALNTPPITTTTPPVKTPKNPARTSKKTTNKTKQDTNKKYGTKDVRTDTTVSTVQANSDNRYTVEEITKELIRQILNGNGNKYVEVKGDFLFKSITKTA